MDILFKNRKMAKAFNENVQLVRKYGPARAGKIRIRMQELRAAESLMDFWPPKSPPGRCHELSEGKRSGQFSVDLDHPYRLIFVPANDPVPRLADGGLDWSGVTAVRILGVEDTHG